MSDGDLGQRLKSIRSFAGMSQEELANATGLSSHTISGIERGKSKPSYDTLAKIAVALGLTTAELAAEQNDAMPLERAQLLADISAATTSATDDELRTMRALVRVIVPKK